MNDPTNFQPVIHNGRYQESFAEPALGCSTFMADLNRPCQSLDGLWSFTIDPYDTCLRGEWFLEQQEDDKGRKIPADYDFDNWEQVPVPGCWNFYDPSYMNYEGPGVFTRTFNWTKGAGFGGSERVFLRFNGVQYCARVFLNKRYLGQHLGGSTPFVVEVGERLENVNRILVVVDNTRKPERVPSMNMDWFNYGGIHRSVELIRTPAAFIRDAFIHLVPNCGFRKMRAEIEADGAPPHAHVELRIPELGLHETAQVKEGRAEFDMEADLELWSPGSPKLYTVEMRLDEDTVRDKVGFREIQVFGNEVLLNGRPTRFLGICLHEETAATGKSLTESEITKDLETAKELGCNFVRLAHYPHSQAVSRLADELGIMLWEEIPVYWDIEFGNSSTLADAENQLCELIRRDRNRASVVIWSVGNENADSDPRLSFMAALASRARRLDPSRLISAACLVDKSKLEIADRLADKLDIIGINEYYGWYDPGFEDLRRLFDNNSPGKPVFITEFGADAKAGHRGGADEFFTEDYQRFVYEQQLSILATVPYVAGISPWILYDFRCPRRTNIFQRGFNRKGIIAEDKRTRKLAFAALRDVYRSLNKEPGGSDK